MTQDNGTPVDPYNDPTKMRAALTAIIQHCIQAGTGHANPMLRPPWAVRVEQMARAGLGQEAEPGTPVEEQGPRVVWTEVGSTWYGEFKGQGVAQVYRIKGEDAWKWSVGMNGETIDGEEDYADQAKAKAEEAVTGRPAILLLTLDDKEALRGRKLYQRATEHYKMSGIVPDFDALEPQARQMWIDKARQYKDWPEKGDDPYAFYLDVDSSDLPVPGYPGMVKSWTPLAVRSSPPRIAPVFTPVEENLPVQDSRHGMLPARQEETNAAQGR